jgi:Core-2/I-Branching enzyme
MRVGYIVTAHTLPDHLVRLVRRLDSDNARFFVHVDARAPASVVATVERELGGAPHVQLLPRHRCHWASFSLVRAALKGIRAILDSPEELDYGVLLTGQDYPLRPANLIERRLQDAHGHSFLTHRPATGRFLRRLTRFHWHGTVLGRRMRLPNRLMPLTLKRSLPAGLEPYTGSAHWCLSRECLRYIGELEARRPELIDFFRWSAVPDEQFFQTILMSSPLAETVVNDDLRYIDWSDDANSPRTLTSDDLGPLLASDALFARKFDPRVDAHVLDALDESIEAQARLVA